MDYPEYYHFFSAQSFSWRGKNYKNHNKMLKTYSVVDGIKTGYTRASGFNIAASAVRYNRRLVGVVMGGRSAKSRDIIRREVENRFDEIMDVMAVAPAVPHVSDPLCP